MNIGHYFSFIWAQMWPNIFAPGFWTLLGVAISHYKIKGHVNKKHAELHQKIDGIKNG